MSSVNDYLGGDGQGYYSNAPGRQAERGSGVYVPNYFSTNEDLPFEALISLDKTDDIQTIVIQSDDDVSWPNYDIENLKLFGTPAQKDIGDLKFDLVVTFGDGSKEIQSFEIKVRAVNDAPELTSASDISVDEDSP